MSSAADVIGALRVNLEQWFTQVLNLESLTLCMLGKNFSRRHFEIFFLFILDNRIWHFMQIVSYEDNLHEVSGPVF